MYKLYTERERERENKFNLNYFIHIVGLTYNNKKH
jgi:hypothetical protein